MSLIGDFKNKHGQSERGKLGIGIKSKETEFKNVDLVKSYWGKISQTRSREVAVMSR